MSNYMDDREKYGNKKLFDAVFGHAIGDALGVPFEFKRRDTYECTDMVGFGTHDQPVGTWSDDTSMTLATLKSIKTNSKAILPQDIRKNFLLWMRDAEFTAGGEMFDIGNGTYSALSSGVPGTSEFTNGNGSLMRILPLAFVNSTDEEVREVSSITHANRISKEACVIYIHVAKRLLAGETIEQIIPTLKHKKPFHRLAKINTLSRDEISSSGYVVDTLEAVLWVIANTNSIEEALLCAVNLGEDTDTVAAIAGGLAGIIYGAGGELYDEWDDKLLNKEMILECLW